ncbi:MAG: transporter [Gammaproteobacteria bacterium]|nr:transporter [Gammaproteobacteria bacterium]
MNKQTMTCGIAAALASLMCATDGWAQDDETRFVLSTGVERDVGTYGGADDIEELYVPLTASISNGRIGFRMTVPYLRVTAPADVSTGEPAATVTESGLGDVTLSATLYNVIESPRMGFVVDVLAGAKLGTADADKGLGTGENDYTVRADAFKFFDDFTLVASGGYRWRGDPEGVDIDNVLLGSLGAAWFTESGDMLGLSYDFREAAYSGLDDIQELTAFYSHRFTDSFDLEIYALTGFSDSSPDWGAGLRVSTDFRMRGFWSRD